MVTKFNVKELRELLEKFDDNLDFVINLQGKPYEIDNVKLGSFDLNEVKDSLEKSMLCVSVQVSNVGE